MAFDMDEINKLLKGISKSDSGSSKSAKDLAKLKGKLDLQLADQQAQHAQQLAAQNAAAQLAAQREAQAADAAAQRDLFQMKIPFEQANLTGTYNGQQTLASRQQQAQVDQFGKTFGEDQRQFNQTFGEDTRQFNTTFGEQQRQFDTETELNKQKLALEKEMQGRAQALDELTQQQQNAIQQGQLDLSRQIETEKVRLQAEQQQAQIKLDTASQSGVMENGQLTEAARAARVREQLESGQLTLQQVQTMGRDASGNLTDASQQWRTQAGLEAARTNAQLGMQSSDYFEAAAYNRDPNVQSALAFLNASGQGSSMGFRSAATGVPGTSSIAALSGGQPINPALQNPQQNIAGPAGATGPSGSLAAAEAALQGQNAAFTSSMHTENQTADPLALKRAAMAGDPQAMAQFQAQQAQQPAISNMDNGFQAAQQQMQQPAVAGSVAAYNQNVSMRPDAAQQRLAQIQGQVIQPGAHKLAPGTMESWSPTEKGLVQSALKASGVNPLDFEQQYKRSQLQTGLSATAI